MNNVVTNGDDRWLAWIAANGWDPCACCDVQGYHSDGDAFGECEKCRGFGFTIPGERWIFDVEEDDDGKDDGQGQP